MKITLVAITFLISLSLIASQALSQPPATQSSSAQIVRGTIAELRTVKLKEVAAAQMMAKIRTNEGTLVVADLGSADTLQTKRLARGYEIAVVGQKGTVNGKEVLFVQEMVTQPPTTQQSSTQPTPKR